MTVYVIEGRLSAEPGDKLRHKASGRIVRFLREGKVGNKWYLVCQGDDGGYLYYPNTDYEEVV